MNEAVTVVKSKEKEDVKSISDGIYLFVKRFLDILFSLIGFIFLIPVFVIVKIAYLLTGDTDPITFSQERIGKDGKVFKLYKFRTMVKNADYVLLAMLSVDKKMKQEYEKNKKLKNDPRITKIGKFLRKTSLDELPQVVNVLKGEMSLIGNRPYLPREMEDMGLYFNDIVKTKPGLTGYWQVNGRSSTDFETRLVFEKYYSNNRSFALDTLIFIKTFKALLFDRSAK